MNYKWKIANVLYAVKHFRLIGSNKRESLVIMTVDKTKTHPGFVDILKAIIGCYYIAKVNGFGFRLNFTHPFYIVNYLQPNKVDWNNKNDISNSYLNSHLLNYYGKGQIPKLKQGEQYHVYNFMGWNILQRNNVYNWEKEWSELYQELFIPSTKLKNVLKHIRAQMPPEYISVHIRFVNAIGITEPKYKQSLLLPNDEQHGLINKCIKALLIIKKEHEIPIVVFSNSNRFLSIAKDKGFIALKGKVGHIRYIHNDETITKMFTDFFIMSYSKEIISLRNENLYNSAFPLYASIIAEKKLKIIQI